MFIIRSYIVVYDWPLFFLYPLLVWMYDVEIIGSGSVMIRCLQALFSGELRRTKSMQMLFSGSCVYAIKFNYSVDQSVN